MSRKSASVFGIDAIECFEWKLGTGIAKVEASNLVGDSIRFTLYRHPEDFVVSNTDEAEISSADIPPYRVQEEVNGPLSDEAEREISEWWREVLRLRDLFNFKTFQISAGVTPDDSFYALVAYLYGVRQAFSYRKIVECMAEDLDIGMDACRERIRRARNRGFLTSPGRGKVGRGRVTKKAVIVLDNERLLRNKSQAERKEWI